MLQFIFRTQTVQWLTKAIGCFALITLLVKAWVDLDWTWDTWGYHLPFAARLWNITPPSSFVFSTETQNRFQSMAILAEWFQGLFWFVFNRVQATNLFSYSSLLLFLWFLKRHFQVPIAWSAVALLGIPLVLIHSTISMVDLPGNLAVSVLILTTFLLFENSKRHCKPEIYGILILSACMATNIKLAHIPITLLILSIAGFKIARERLRVLINSSQRVRWGAVAVGLVSLTAVLVLAVPIKNWATYGNPFHGILIRVGGVTLSEGEDFTYDVPKYLTNSPSPQRWLYSVLEVNRPPFNWTHDQHYPSNVFRMGDPPDRMGGYFRDAVLFHVLQFIILIVKSKNQHAARVALITMGIVTLLAACSPQSFHLRYYMYWIIVLISLNLYFLFNTPVQKESNPIQNYRWVVGLVNLYLFYVVVFATQGKYILPQFQTVERLKALVVGQTLNQVQPNQTYCIKGGVPFSLLYTDKFNKPFHYTIECGGWPPSLKDDSVWPPLYKIKVIKGSCQF